MSFIARHKVEKDLICEVLQSHVMPYVIPPEVEGGQPQRGYTSLCSVVWFREGEEGLEPLGGEESSECPALESAKLLEFEALDWDDYHDEDDEIDSILPEITPESPLNVAEKEA